MRFCKKLFGGKMVRRFGTMIFLSCLFIFSNSRALFSAQWWDLRFTDGKNTTYDTVIESVLEGYILSANTLVYFADYSTPAKNTRVTTSLNSRFAAGVDVKYVGDGDEGNYTGLSASIPFKLDAKGYPIMHEKFLVIDPDSSNRKMVTGSGNYTTGGWGNQDSAWLFLNEQKIINKYLAEFNKMFGGTFHAGSVTTNPVTTTNGITVYTLFSPKDGPWAAGSIVDTTIRAATESVFFETTGHDEGNLGTLNLDAAIQSVLDDSSKPKFFAEGVVNNMGTSTSSSTFNGIALNNYNKKGGYIRRSAVNGFDKHHSKYIVVDMDWLGVGSVNASPVSSEDKTTSGNDEDHIFINDFRLARAFMREFSRHYKLDAVVGSIDNPSVTEIHDWTAPAVPQSLKVTPAANSFSVSWTAPSDPGDFSRYYIFISTNNNINTAKNEITESDGSFRSSFLRPEKESKGRTSTSVSLTTYNEGDQLAAGTNYYFGVVSVDKFGNESAALTAGPYKLSGGGGNADGSGKATLSKTGVAPNTYYTSITYTLKPTAGGSLGGGTVEVTIPSGWTAPIMSPTTGKGYVKAYIYKTGTTSVNLICTISGQKVTITGSPASRLAYNSGDQVKLVYAKYTTQATEGTATFNTRTAGAGGTLTTLPAANQAKLTVSNTAKSVSGEIYDTTATDEDTEVESENGGVKPASLGQNYPNPFNPSTTFNYFIPEGGRVVLKLYNVANQEVATVVNEDQRAGEHSVKYDSGDQLSRGVYYYRLTVSGKEIGTKRAVVLK